MPVDPNAALASTRVRAALEAAVGVIDMLGARPPRVFQARMGINRIVSELRRAAESLRAWGQSQALVDHAERMATWYAGEMAKMVRPSSLGQVASEIAAAQGLLMSADPLGPAPAA